MKTEVLLRMRWIIHFYKKLDVIRLKLVTRYVHREGSSEMKIHALVYLVFLYDTRLQGGPLRFRRVDRSYIRDLIVQEVAMYNHGT